MGNRNAVAERRTCNVQPCARSNGSVVCGDVVGRAAMQHQIESSAHDGTGGGMRQLSWNTNSFTALFALSPIIASRIPSLSDIQRPECTKCGVCVVEYAVQSAVMDVTERCPFGPQ